MITPILKNPKAHGGTLYTFPSASRDLTRAFTNSEYEFSFSHFACLNLPDFRYGTFKEGDLKGMYLDNLRPNSISDVNDLNTSLKWHLQSYVMNYEIAILNGFSLDSGKYDSEVLRTPSERIFFNWLKRVGAIKFNGNEEVLSGYGDEVVDLKYETLIDESYLELVSDKTKNYRIGNKLYVWKGGEWRSRVLVSKTVQYIGTIDMINNVNIDNDSFNEIYLNIPAGVGGSTKVHFDNNVFDVNYEKDEVIDVKNDLYCDKDDERRDYIIGRNPKKIGIVDDVTFNAIYDSKYDNDAGYSSPTYIIDNGYCINFNDSEYTGGAGGIGIENMNLSSTEDFEFNCVLIYYRIRKGNGSWYTNLYGVLLLEEVTTSDFRTDINDDDERMGYIQRYPKFKKGNSWGLKLDLKIDAQPDSQMELRDKLYDDPNEGTGMQMFIEALMQLNDCVKIFYDVKKENTDIEERLYKLENIMSGVDSVYDLRSDVNALRTKVEMFQPTPNSLSGRIDNVENRVTSLETKLGYLIKEVDNINKKTVDLGYSITSLKNDFNKELNNMNEKTIILDGRLTSLENVFNDLIGNSDSDSDDVI